MGPAKTAQRTKNSTTTAQTTAILSRASRPSAMRMGDLPAISLDWSLLGSSGSPSSFE